MVTVLVTAGCSRGFDPALRDEGVAKANEALAVCQEHVPEEAEALDLLLATPTTAGVITQEARTARRQPIEPWDSLPPDHAVSRCVFGTSPEDVRSSWLIDDAGRVTKDTSPSRGT